jgi:hypothetical protein
MKPTAAQIALINALKPFASRSAAREFPAVLAGQYPLERFFRDALHAVMGRPGAKWAPLLPEDCACGQSRATNAQIANLRALAEAAGIAID